MGNTKTLTTREHVAQLHVKVDALTDTVCTTARLEGEVARLEAELARTKQEYEHYAMNTALRSCLTPDRRAHYLQQDLTACQQKVQDREAIIAALQAEYDKTVALLDDVRRGDRSVLLSNLVRLVRDNKQLEKDLEQETDLRQRAERREFNARQTGDTLRADNARLQAIIDGLCPVNTEHADEDEEDNSLD